MQNTTKKGKYQKQQLRVILWWKITRKKKIIQTKTMIMSKKQMLQIEESTTT
jgi:hypothetical protein